MLAQGMKTIAAVYPQPGCTDGSARGPKRTGSLCAHDTAGPGDGRAEDPVARDKEKRLGHGVRLQADQVRQVS